MGSCRAELMLPGLLHLTQKSLLYTSLLLQYSSVAVPVVTTGKHVFSCACMCMNALITYSTALH